MIKKIASILTMVLAITIIFSSCTLLEKIPFLNKNKYNYPPPGDEVANPSDNSESESTSSGIEEEVKTENDTMPDDIDDILSVDGSDQEITEEVFDLIDEDSSSKADAGKTSTTPASAGSAQPKKSVSESSTSSASSQENTASSSDEKTKSNNEVKVADSKSLANPKTPPEKTDPSKTPMIDDEDLDKRLSELSDEIFYLINLERTEAGLSPLEAEPSLITAAGIRAKESSQFPDLAHDRPDGTKCHTVLEDVEYSKSGLVMGENLVFTVYDATAEKLVDLWRNSEGHRLNYMDATYKYSGLAIYYSSNAKFALSCAQIFTN